MIFVEDTEVKIGGHSLPGVFKSLEVNGNAIIDEIETESKGKKPKQATGFEDATVKLEITLIETENQSIEDKIKYINDIFHPSGETVPKLYKIVNAHTAARGITEVIFKSFSTKETDKNDEVTGTLEFCECPQITVVKKKATTNSSKATTTTSESSTTKNSYFTEEQLEQINKLKEKGQRFSPKPNIAADKYVLVKKFKDTKYSPALNPLEAFTK